MGKVTITNVSEVRLCEASCPDCTDPHVREVQRLQRVIAREAVTWYNDRRGLRRVKTVKLSSAVEEYAFYLKRSERKE